MVNYIYAQSIKFTHTVRNYNDLICSTTTVKPGHLYIQVTSLQRPPKSKNFIVTLIHLYKAVTYLIKPQNRDPKVTVIGRFSLFIQIYAKYNRECLFPEVQIFPIQQKIFEIYDQST